MARPIGYDPKEVLSNAMHLFWTKGYEATAISDIVKVTGLKPGSLYNLYGSKEGIFNAVLEMYATSAIQEVKNILNKEDDALKNIEQFLNEVVIQTILNEDTNGCLLVKTLLVVSHKDEKIQNYITNVFTEVEELLKLSIEKAIISGQTTVNAKQYAKFIITTMYGSHVYYKSKHDELVLRESISYLLKVLHS